MPGTDIWILCFSSWAWRRDASLSSRNRSVVSSPANSCGESRERGVEGGLVPHLVQCVFWSGRHRGDVGSDIMSGFTAGHLDLDEEVPKVLFEGRDVLVQAEQACYKHLHLGTGGGGEGGRYG